MDDHLIPPLIEGYIAALVSRRAEDDRCEGFQPLMDSRVEDDEDGFHRTFILSNGMKFAVRIEYVGPDTEIVIEEVI